ncbi:MAG: hypothetical protein ACM31C_09405 [Acidobacteriota bacterium]
MRSGLAIVVLGALAACGDPPPLQLKYTLSTKGQACYAANGSAAQSCSDVAMLCKAVLSVRIISPSDPSTPFVSQCVPVIGRPDLCSIAGIDLPPPTVKIPSQTLEVQVAVYVDSDLDHDPVTSDPICPTDLQFTPEGLPAEATPSPAIGGRAFYHPGDTETVVALGCTDEPAIQDPKCVNQDTVAVTATVDDFDTEVAVPPTLADQLNVLVGEPQPVTIGATTAYELSPTQTRPLDRTVTGPTPAWGASVDLKLQATACLEVLEDVPQATPSVTCKRLPSLGVQQLNLGGVRLAKTTLDQILAALPSHPTQFPAQGLVVGIVLDQLGNPVANAQVTVDDPSNPMASALALSENRQQVLAGATTSNGIFISTDAGYGSMFSVGTRGTAFGGLVAGKVTTVVLQLSP